MKNDNSFEAIASSLKIAVLLMVVFTFPTSCSNLDQLADSAQKIAARCQSLPTPMQEERGE